MLIVWLRLSIIHLVHTQKVLGAAMHFRLSIVAKHANGGTDLAEVVFKRFVYLLLCLHRVSSMVSRIYSKEILEHRASPMSRYSVVTCRVITKESISSMPFVQTWNVGRWES